MPERGLPAEARDADLSLATARLLLELSREVSASLDLQEVLDRGLAALRKLVPFDGGSIQLVREGALQLAAADPPPTKEALEFRLPLGEGFGGRVAVSGEPFYSPDATIDPRAHPEGKARASSAGVRSYFAAPLVQGGEIVGVAQFDSQTVDAFSTRQQALVLAFVPTIAAAVQNARLYEREVEALDELRDAEAAKSDFLAMISHELRTPVTSLVGFSETLERFQGRIDAERMTTIIGWMVQRSRGLMRLIEDLLDVTAMERSMLSVRPEAVDLSQLVCSWAQLSDHEGADVRLDIEAELPPVVVDAARIRQILDNLLSNARKFSPRGAEVLVRVFRVAGRVCIEVIDHGRGIPQDLQPRVFERFFQAERTTDRTAGGLGVGLYLVKLLCDLMDVTVAIRSEPGRGTTVTLGLPAAEGANATSARSDPAGATIE